MQLNVKGWGPQVVVKKLGWDKPLPDKRRWLGVAWFGGKQVDVYWSPEGNFMTGGT